MLYMICVMIGALALAITPAIVCNLNELGPCLGANGLALIFGPLCLVFIALAVVGYRDEKAKKSRDSEPEVS